MGEWKDDKKDGQGTYIYGKGKLKGDKYIGEFRDGYRNGQGSFTWSDEGKYEGKWKNKEKWNGIGYDKNGDFVVRFVNGEQQ